jgi:glycogen debranching enzyme
MEDVIKVQDNFYILATSARADERTRVLKDGDAFAIFDHYGDVLPVGLGEQGLFYGGTRFLSSLSLRLGTVRPLLLSSTVKATNDLLLVDLTNPDIPLDGHLVIPRGTLHLFRGKFLNDGACYERIRVSNHGLTAIRLSLTLRFDADFADIFEVRGTERPRRGERLPTEVEGSQACLCYRGLDGVLRKARFAFHPPPSQLDGHSATYDIHLQPQQSEHIHLTVACEVGENASRARPAFDEAHDLYMRHSPLRQQRWEVFTSNEQFNDWVNRSSADLHMMVTTTPYGQYPYAGVPWFSTPFGRDGIITALELLWLEPELARGVLSYLAATQARDSDPARDAEPGKILHETRGGEMAALGEVPFGMYYGSVDATPLFVVLAGAYYKRTGDREFLESIWENVERALEWIDTRGDLDRDGFVEYARRSPKGLVQQGWKDSHDSIFHADGSLAEEPIALCEVQGYVYAARRGAAQVALALGRSPTARRLVAQAEALRQRFEECFWSEALGTYALALDGRKQPCLVRASNAGHALFSGIASLPRAEAVCGALFHADSFSGWGIRTVACCEARYNPMSYHNGSVWPHDNALIALGLSRYRLTHRALDVMTGLFDASIFVDLHRLPELVCGFKKRSGEGPTLYPVACAPQAWSAGAVFMLLQACLGLTIDAPRRQIALRRPMLPDSIDSVRIRGLRVGPAVVDLFLERHAENVGVNVLRRDGQVEIATYS